MKNRVAANYAIFRWADVAGSRVSVAEADEILAEIEKVVPGVTRILEREWRKPRRTTAGAATSTGERETGK